MVRLVHAPGGAASHATHWQAPGHPGRAARVMALPHERGHNTQPLPAFTLKGGQQLLVARTCSLLNSSEMRRMLPSRRCLARRSASSRSSPLMLFSACARSRGGQGWVRELRHQQVVAVAAAAAAACPGNTMHSIHHLRLHCSASIACGALCCAVPPHLACLLGGLVLLLARVGQHLLEAGGPVLACRAAGEGARGSRHGERWSAQPHPWGAAACICASTAGQHPGCKPAGQHPGCKPAAQHPGGSTEQSDCRQQPCDRQRAPGAWNSGSAASSSRHRSAYMATNVGCCTAFSNTWWIVPCSHGWWGGQRAVRRGVGCSHG